MASANEIAQRIAKGLLVHGFDNEQGAEDVIMSHLPLIEKTIAEGIGNAEGDKLEKIKELVQRARSHVCDLNEVILQLSSAGAAVKLDEKERRSVSGSIFHYSVLASVGL